MHHACSSPRVYSQFMCYREREKRGDDEGGSVRELINGKICIGSYLHDASRVDSWRRIRTRTAPMGQRIARECELSISYLMDELSRNLTLPSRARTRAALDFGDISRPCIVCLCHLRRDAMAVMMYVTRERNISAVLPRGRDYQK